MKDVLKDVDIWRERGDAIALATVISVKRSAPRPPGSKMAVNEHGEISGAVSGGCVEGAVVEVAEKVINGGDHCETGLVHAPYVLVSEAARRAHRRHTECQARDTSDSSSSASVSREAIELPGSSRSTCGIAAFIPRVSGS